MYIVRVCRQGEFLYDRDFDRAQLIMGRGNDCDITLAHGTVSRRHATIYWRDNRFWVADLGSSNGTFVNGQPFRGEYTLNEGDIVYCGIFSLEVRRAHQAPAPRPEVQQHPQHQHHQQQPRYPQQPQYPQQAPSPYEQQRYQEQQREAYRNQQQQQEPRYEPPRQEPRRGAPALGDYERPQPPAEHGHPHGPRGREAQEDPAYSTIEPGEVSAAELHEQIVQQRQSQELARAEPEPSSATPQDPKAGTGTDAPPASVAPPAQTGIVPNDRWGVTPPPVFEGIEGPTVMQDPSRS